MSDTAIDAFESLEALSKMQLVDREAAVKKAYEAARKDLRAGIDHESEEEIKLALPALDAAVNKIDPGLDACERMQSEAQPAAGAQPFVAAHREEVKKMVSEAAAKKELTEWAARGAQAQGGGQPDRRHRAQGRRRDRRRARRAEEPGPHTEQEITACKNGFPKHEKAAREATDKDNGKDGREGPLAMLDLMEKPKRQPKGCGRC